MQRILVIVLAAFDAVIAVAVGVVLALAPLTLLWVFGFASPAWSALWPAAGTVWQLGHLVPLSVSLPGDYLAVTGIDADAASFTLSLAPLAFAAFTAIFAARSGARAARAGAWITGVVTGSVVVTVLAVLIALTSDNAVASVSLAQAALLPAVVFAAPALLGAVVTAWREGDGGLVDRLHDRIDDSGGGWDIVPGLVVRGTAVAVIGLIGVGALALAVALVLRGGEIVSLFGTGNADGIGASVITLAQLAYLPTLVVWALAFVAGPGFAVGVGTSVTSAGTQVGVVPAIPILGALPESMSSWLLALAVLPVIVGGLAGGAVRGRIWSSAMPRPDAAAAVPLHPALAGLIPDRPTDSPKKVPGLPADRAVVRLTVAVGIAVLTAASAALLAVLAFGSIGPGRLADVGAAAGPVALAVGVETLVGAGIVLLTTRRRRAPVEEDEGSVSAADPSATPEHREPVADDTDTDTDPDIDTDPDPARTLAAISRISAAPGGLPDEADRAALTPRRPIPLPPID